MIDWLTLHVCWSSSDVSDLWSTFCDYRWPGWARVEVGEVVGVRYDWQRLRSDSREVTVAPRGDGFTVCGSPCSALGMPNNVFGSGSLEECREAMVEAAFEALRGQGWELGREWVGEVRCTRADHTLNVLLPSAGHVQALMAGIGGIETGRYRTGRKYGSTVYLGGKSRRRRSKVYCKGAHLRYLLQRGKVDAVAVDDLQRLDRVARLELEFGRDWWAQRSWDEACGCIEDEAVAYWSGLWGEVGEVAMEREEYGRVVEAAGGNERVGRAAYRTLGLIRSQGKAAAELSVSRATWFRHLRVLRAAGYGEAELMGACQVFRFPVREVLACRVDSWDELRRAA